MFWSADFAPADFASFFSAHAERVQWWQSVQCPCGQSVNAPSNINCTACGGLGVLYPNPPTTIWAVLTQVRQEQMLPDVGMMLPGDMTVDQPPWAIPLGMWDLIRTPWAEPFEGERIRRGAGATDALAYVADSVSWCGTVLPAVGVSATYVEGVDFSVSGKAVTWVPGHGPEAGTLYSIQYQARFEWSPAAPGMVRMERGTNLGQRTLCRKRHLVLRTVPTLPEAS